MNVEAKDGSEPATAAINPDAAGWDDSNSALFLALQNPTLSKAASVLLRSMQETGTISGEDATLMSAFLASCDTSCEIPPGGSAGNKRDRDMAQSADADPAGDGDDEIRAAAVSRTVTAQILDSEWVSRHKCDMTAFAIVHTHQQRILCARILCAHSSPLTKSNQPHLHLSTRNHTLHQEPNPIRKKPKSMSQSKIPISDSQSVEPPAAVAQNGNGAVSDSMQMASMQSVPSEYTHEKRLSDPGSCAPCRRLSNPLNTTPIKGRESHTSDLDAFDRYVNVIRHASRPPTVGPYSEDFWSHIRGILKAAVPVGFEELPDKDAVVPRGPADCAKFLGKVVATASINPIHPNIVAEAAKLPLATVLNELFCATHLGLVDMQWAPLCERCGSMACAKTRIEDLPGSAYCGGCQYENTVDCLEKIKVVFTLNRDAFYVLMANFAVSFYYISLPAVILCCSFFSLS